MLDRPLGPIFMPRPRAENAVGFLQYGRQHPKFDLQTANSNAKRKVEIRIFKKNAWHKF
jgi:hypothetical protein